MTYIMKSVHRSCAVAWILHQNEQKITLPFCTLELPTSSSNYSIIQTVDVTLLLKLGTTKQPVEENTCINQTKLPFPRLNSPPNSITKRILFPNVLIYFIDHWIWEVGNWVWDALGLGMLWAGGAWFRRNWKVDIAFTLHVFIWLSQQSPLATESLFSGTYKQYKPPRWIAGLLNWEMGSSSALKDNTMRLSVHNDKINNRPRQWEEIQVKVYRYLVFEAGSIECDRLINGMGKSMECTCCVALSSLYSMGGDVFDKLCIQL